MHLRLKIWYNNLTSIKQLTVLFFSYWLFWFLVSLLQEKFFDWESHPIFYHILRATWMAFGLMIVFEWKKIKSLFQHNKK